MIDLNSRWQNAMRRSEFVQSREVATKHHHRRVFVVQSESQPNLMYQVIVQRGRVKCSCPAGSHGLPCKHQAKVMREMGVMV